ncbi:MAG: hypothetical protein AAFV98_19075, partial [Chloroflexota bacterium]
MTKETGGNTVQSNVTTKKVAQDMDALQYFHYGQLVHHGEAKGDLRVLAKSSGVDDDFIALALETAIIPALAEATGASWGIIRTKRGQPLMLARAEQSATRQVMHQFIAMPTATLRALAGNLSVLKPHVLDPLPEYQMLGDDLTPITLSDVEPTTEQQVDSLLDLMSYARNNTRNIQPILATLVDGKQLVVINAPKEGEARMGFVQGLLALLPASTRLGITFLLHATPNETFKTQIVFMESVPDDVDDKKQVVYDWDAGAVQGDAPKNDYSRFIVGQMRLDPELVTRETEKLTRAAGWRFNSGDNLSQALDYASHRAKVDQSLENGMPVEVSSVAKILNDDPTLSDEQRLMYSRHLVNFSLALDDLQHVDSIMATMQQQKDLEDEVYRFMSKAVTDGQSEVIFETMLRWQSDPFSPTGDRWQRLLSKVALAELDEIVAEGDPELISDFLTDVNELGRQVTPIVGRIVDKVLPFTEDNPEISSRVLLLAIRNLDDTKLQALLNSPRIIKTLPRDIQRFMVLLAQPQRKAPPGTLVRAVNALDDPVRKDALVAFVRQAYASRRIDLIDERALADFVETVNKHPLLLDRDTLAAIAEQIQARTLRTMKQPAPRLILQMFLLSQHYGSLRQALTMQATHIYGLDAHQEFSRSVQDAFAKTNLSVEDAQLAIDELEQRGLNKLTVTAAILGALEGTDWHADMMSLADRVMIDVANSIALLEALHPVNITTLIKYVARRGDAHRLRITARVMGSCSAYERTKVGLKATNHAYKMLQSTERTKPYALEVVRQYVREADERAAQHMIKYYGDRLGEDTANSLRMSYEFSNLMGRLDWLTYADALRITVDILQHAVEAYDNASARPNLGYMRLFVENIRRGSELGQRKNLVTNLRRLAHAIVVLGQRHNRRSSTNDKHNEAIVTGEKDP